MSVRVTVVLAAMTSCLGACATPPSPSSPPSFATPPGPVNFASALAAARAARDRAFALRPPSPSDFERASDAAIASGLGRWASARRDATQEAQRAYNEALGATQDPADEAELHGELADLWLRLAEDTSHALLAATPSQHRNEASLAGHLQGALAEALRPLRDRVAAHLEACQRIVDVARSASAAAATCAAVARRFEAADRPSAAGATLRPILRTTRPKPCTFKGTLVTRGTVYAGETGTSALLTVDPRVPIEVEALHVSNYPGGRYKVTVSWPKAVEGYLQTDEAPFVLMRQVELVHDVVWAPPGERVAASDERGPTVRAIHTYVGPEGGGATRRPIPNTLDRRLFCHDLELATSGVEPPAPAAAGRGRRGTRVRLTTDVTVPLLARPGGPPVAGVVADEVQLLERQGRFVRVTGDTPFEFDGWVDSSFLQPPEGTPAPSRVVPSAPPGGVATVDANANGAPAAAGEDTGEEIPADATPPPRPDAPILSETYEPAKVFRQPTPGTSYVARATVVEGYDGAIREAQLPASGPATRPSLFTGVEASVRLVTWTRETDRQELALEARGQHYVSAPDADDGTVDGLWAGSFTLDRRTTLGTAAIATVTSTNSARLVDGTLFRIDPSASNRVYTLESGHLGLLRELSPVWRLTAAMDLAASTTLKQTAVPLSNGSSVAHAGLDYVTTGLGLALGRDFDLKNTGTVGVSYTGTYLAAGLRATTAPGTSGAAATSSSGNATVAWTHIFDERLRSTATLGSTIAERPPLDPGRAPIVSPVAGLALTYTRAFWVTTIDLTYAYGSVNPALGFGPTAGAAVALQGIPIPRGAWYRFSVVASGIANRATLLQGGGSEDLDYVGASLQARYAASSWFGLVAGDDLSYSAFEQANLIPPVLRHVVSVGVSALIANPRTILAAPLAF